MKDDALSKILLNDINTLSPEELTAKYGENAETLRKLIVSMETNSSQQKEVKKRTFINLSRAIKENFVIIFDVTLIIAGLIAIIIHLFTKNPVADNVGAGIFGFLMLYKVVIFIIVQVLGIKEFSRNLDKTSERYKLFEKSDNLINSGMNSQAESILRKLLSEEPHNPDYWFKLGQALDNMNNIHEALLCYKNCIDNFRSEKGSSFSASAYNNIGIIKMKQGKKDEAIEAFETASLYGSPQAKQNLIKIKSFSTEN